MTWYLVMLWVGNCDISKPDVSETCFLQMPSQKICEEISALNGPDQQCLGVRHGK